VSQEKYPLLVGVRIREGPRKKSPRAHQADADLKKFSRY
jgi:hypothetical protein